MSLRVGTNNFGKRDSCSSYTVGGQGLPEPRIKRRRVEVQLQGSSLLRSFKEEFEDYGFDKTCKHPCVHNGFCLICGQNLDSQYGVEFGYIHEGLRLSTDGISHLRKTNTHNALIGKKLHLVLDLDHTLIHTIALEGCVSDIKQLLGNRKGEMFLLEAVNGFMVTRLRPFVHNFLREASAMFDLYIFTKGSRYYALEIAKLLDPEQVYFKSKIISKDEYPFPGKKSLDMVLGEERAVLILDDKDVVWPDHVSNNLLRIPRYDYFISSTSLRDCLEYNHSLATNTNESKTKGVLALMLGLLKEIHREYFEVEDNVATGDVREVVRKLRLKILEGCKIVVSLDFDTQFPFTVRRLCELVGQMGATWSEELDASVTHVVSMNMRAEESRWALEEGKFLVNPQWLEDVNCYWKRQPEAKYQIEEND